MAGPGFCISARAVAGSDGVTVTSATQKRRARQIVTPVYEPFRPDFLERALIVSHGQIA